LKGGKGFGFLQVLYSTHCFICVFSDSTVPEDAGTEPMTVVSSNHSAKSLILSILQALSDDSDLHSGPEPGISLARIGLPVSFPERGKKN
jgi:hypothetical protein